jgi:hypothetical protein
VQPTVLDRFIQQAVMQVLQAAWDPTFSEASFGFRPGRSATSGSPFSPLHRQSSPAAHNPRGSRTQKPFDQSEAEVSPCEHTARGHYVTVIDHHSIGFGKDVGKLGG